MLVVEAAAQSGSLITARQAAEQGRDVFALPGSIHAALAKGCHQLIREGARLVETVNEILEAMQVSPLAAASSASNTLQPKPIAPIYSTNSDTRRSTSTTYWNVLIRISAN